MSKVLRSILANSIHELHAGNRYTTMAVLTAVHPRHPALRGISCGHSLSSLVYQRWHSNRNGRNCRGSPQGETSNGIPIQKHPLPDDFDDNSLAALDSAAQIAHQNDGTVYVLHIVPMIVAPTAMPVYVDLYKGQEEVALTKLQEIARKHLSGVTSASKAETTV